MSASKITEFRSPRHLSLLRAIAKDKADTLVGDNEFPFVFRGKLRCTPTDRDDLRIIKTRKFYECTEKDHSEWGSFDTTNKINRLRQRRVSRKLVPSLDFSIPTELLPYEEV
jgi:hypothetical protein